MLAVEPASVPDLTLALSLPEMGEPSGAHTAVAHTEAAPMRNPGQGIAGSLSVRLDIILWFLRSQSTS